MIQITNIYDCDSGVATLAIAVFVCCAGVVLLYKDQLSVLIQRFTQSKKKSASLFQKGAFQIVAWHRAMLIDGVSWSLPVNIPQRQFEMHPKIILLER